MDKLEAVGDPELRKTLLWARSQPRPVAADDLAAARGIHRNVARSRLERLAGAGLLVPGYERRTGRSGPGAGRPAKVYAVAPEVAGIEFPGRHYEALIGLLAAALPVERRPEQLRSVGAELGRHLALTARLRPAKSLRTAFERVCEAVRSLGFQASVLEVNPTGAVIATPTCPLRPLVSSHPGAAEIDRGMWAGLAGAALGSREVGDVVCETHSCLDHHGSCRVVIKLTGQPRPA
jgi:predicted ArsR family transcriptional regulator